MELFKPKVVCFSCNFGWGYLSENPALASQIANWIPVVCSGKIDTNHILKAFKAGADGVLILGCLERHCHYQDGNIQTRKKTLLLQKVLKTFGIEPERVEMRFSMDPEGKSMPPLLDKMNNNLMKLGPVRMVFEKEVDPMAGKPKVAIYWLGACGGCDEAIVDLNTAILQVVEAVDIVFWPVAMDFKYDRIESMEDGEIDLSILTGSVRNSDHEEMAKLFRKKSKLVLSFGACACFGGTAGLANFNTRTEIFNWVYHEAPTVVNPEARFPQTETRIDGQVLTLPKIYDHVYTLDQVVDVDYYLPGCPPPPDLILNAMKAVIAGDLPPKGSTLAPHMALCDTCARNKKKPPRMEIKEIHRIHEVEADPDSCFLAEGIICLGPATRTGCGETCIKANIPCRGCFGPPPGVNGDGTRYLAALTSLIKADTEEEIQVIIDSIVDPAGYFYRFTQPISILGKKKPGERVEESK